ncbi:MAG: TetR/AcrR family transcriptional regulator [Kouleothrix sp.]
MTELAYNPTAQKILGIAARLFMQLGYRAVSINDIVKAAEVTKPTLYYYFPDKAELFTQMALQRLVDMHTAIDTALAGADTIAARLEALAGVLLNASDGDMRMLRHEMAEHLDQAHQERLSQAFQQHLFVPIMQVMQAGLARGELVRHSAAELTMLFLGLMEAFHGFTDQIDHLKMPSQLGQFRPTVFSATALVALFLHGVADARSEELQ